MQIIIQARMGSNRLPGKMLMPIINKKGALELMIERVSKVQIDHQLIIATTDLQEDNAIEKLCDKLNVNCFRGDSDDVLSRFYNASKYFGKTDIIVRLTGDCPLHDPTVIEKVIHVFLAKNVDYASNTDPETYPDGLDVSVIGWNALEKAFYEAKKISEREHVVPYIINHPEMFSKINVVNEVDTSIHRCTLDEIDDFKLIKAIYSGLYDKDNIFNMDDILSYLEQNKDLIKLNQHIKRNEGYYLSLEKESNDKSTI